MEKANGEIWTVEKRYSEFDELVKNLKSLFGNLPSLPGKTMFKLKEKHELDERMNLLDKFLKVFKNYIKNIYNLSRQY